MFRKLTALLLIASVMLTPCVTFADQKAASELEAQQALLTALEIISPDSHGEIDNEKPVTRVDFAAMVGKILGVNPTIAERNSYYADIAPDNWASYTLNSLVDMGILHVGEERLFHPYDTISLYEAVKILTCVLGYGNLAQYKGGYPYGYFSVASELGLLTGVKDGGEADVANASMTALLYNAVHTRMMDVFSVGTQTEISNKNTDLLMTRYLKVDYLEGVLNGADGFTLTETDVGEGKCRVDDVMLQTEDVSVIDKLGHEVRAYYYAEKEGDIKTLRYLADTRNTEAFTVMDEAIVGYENGKLTYLDEKDKRRSVTIASNAVVMRNGAVVSEGLSGAFAVDNGQIRLISNASSGVIDAAIIEDYRTVVVNTVNAETMQITDDIDKASYIDLSGGRCERVSIYTADGEKTQLAAIQAQMVIDIAYSEKHTIIYTNSVNINGTVNAIDTSNREVDIDGTNYPYSAPLFDVYRCKVGDSGLFKTNRRGKIVCMLEPAMSDQAGYLIAAASRGGIDNAVQVRLLTAAGEVESFNIAEKAKIDGMKMENIKDASGLLNGYSGSPILYRANADKEITYIDTPDRNELYEDEYTLQLTGSTDRNNIVTRWNPGQNKFGKRGLVSSDAVVFQVPKDGSDTDERNFSVTTIGKFASNTGYDTDLYKSGIGSYNNIVVLRMTSFNLVQETPYLWVESVSRAVNADGDVVARVRAYNKGALTEYDIDSAYDIIPDVGDIVRIGTNEKRPSRLVEIHYDYSKKGSGAIDPEAEFGGYDTVSYWNRFVDLFHTNRLIIGYPVEVEDNLIKWGIEGHGTEIIEETGVVKSTVPVIVYDAEAKKFYQGGISDVKPSKIYGAECSDIIATTSYGAINALYVINNRKDY